MELEHIIVVERYSSYCHEIISIIVSNSQSDTTWARKITNIIKWMGFRVFKIYTIPPADKIMKNTARFDYTVNEIRFHENRCVKNSPFVC